MSGITHEKALELAAEKYRQAGYEVDIVHGPSGAQYDLVARRGAETVAVEVKTRNEWYQIPAGPPSPALPPGWRFDLVVIPAGEPGDVAAPGPAPAASVAESLLNEFDELLPKGAFRARFLLAWAAAEAALRVAAHREQPALDLAPPRQIISQLVTDGVLTHEQYDRLRQLLAIRNRLVHGLPVDAVVQPEDAAYLADLTRSLLAAQTAMTAS